MIIAWPAICQILCCLAAYYIAQAKQTWVAVLTLCLCWRNLGRQWRRRLSFGLENHWIGVQNECPHVAACAVLRRRQHGHWNWFAHKLRQRHCQQRHSRHTGGLGAIMTQTEVHQARMLAPQVVKSRGTGHAGGHLLTRISQLWKPEVQRHPEQEVVLVCVTDLKEFVGFFFFSLIFPAAFGIKVIFEDLRMCSVFTVFIFPGRLCLTCLQH